jgi:hypothetical protein
MGLYGEMPTGELQLIFGFFFVSCVTKKITNILMLKIVSKNFGNFINLTKFTFP